MTKKRVRKKVSPGIFQIAANPEIFEKEFDEVAAEIVKENYTAGRGFEKTFASTYKKEGVRQQPGSGSGPYRKGDAVCGRYLLQLKFLTQSDGKLRFKKSWLNAAESDCKRTSGVDRYAIVVAAKANQRVAYVVMPEYSDLVTVETLPTVLALSLDEIRKLKKIYKIDKMQGFVIMNLETFFELNKEADNGS
jgi:hypothetical protein